MGLDFNAAAGNGLSVPDHANLTDMPVGSIVALVNPTAIGTAGRFMQKGTAGNQLTFINNATSVELIINRFTTNLNIRALHADLPSYGNGKLCGIACTWDLNGVGTDQKLYHWDGATAPAEAAAYAAATAGSGTRNSDSGSLLYLFNHVSLNSNYKGVGYYIALFRFKLSAAEILAFSKWPWPVQASAAEGMWELGVGGTGLHTDLTGHGHTATVLASTPVAAHVAMAPFRYAHRIHSNGHDVNVQRRSQRVRRAQRPSTGLVVPGMPGGAPPPVVGTGRRSRGMTGGFQTLAGGF